MACPSSLSLRHSGKPQRVDKAFADVVTFKVLQTLTAFSKAMLELPIRRPATRASSGVVVVVVPVLLLRLQQQPARAS